MSDDVTHLEDELGLNTPDASEDDASTGDAADSARSNAEDPSAGLDELAADLDREERKQEFVKDQVNKFGSKILAGNLSYEDIPKAQKWMIPQIAEFVTNASKAVEAQPISPEQIAEMVKKEHLEQKKLDEYRAELVALKEADIPFEDKRKIMAEAKKLRDEEKLSPLSAFRIAKKINPVDFTPTPPPAKAGEASSQTQKAIDLDQIDPNTLSTKQLAEYVSKLKRG